MTAVIRGSVRPTGFFAMRSSVGCSVARANAPRESIMRLTQRSWTAVSGTWPDDNAATKLIVRAATFTITISELSLATSVPWIPMESPMSASLSAGASFVPSPVTATTWPFCFRHFTIKSLSNGDDLAIMQILSIFAIPIAFAVKILSPVIILILTPASLQASTASLAPGRQGSLIPTNPSKIVVAEPIVSQAESFRTIALSFIILFIETAKFSVTAKGISGLVHFNVVALSCHAGFVNSHRKPVQEQPVSSCIAINPAILISSKHSRHCLNSPNPREPIHVPLANHFTQHILVNVKRGFVILILNGNGNKRSAAQ
nr:hypothetical protein PanWU01x14_004110 [Ipomoea trifida]